MYIYLHIPFCASKCIYCDFFVVLEKHGGQSAYIETLCREIEARLKGKPNLPPVETLYVGGGTPSLLSAADYQRIFDTLRQFTPFADNAEITLEANPLHMRDNPEVYLATGFNRLSVGVQSLNDEELKRLSRAHTAVDAIGFIKSMQQAGFQNISIDLMYAIPGQTRDSWHETLDQVMGLGVQHISMYGLKIEDNTPLARLRHFERYHVPTEDENVAMYFAGLEKLEAAGFHRYEFSNLGKPGLESRHNLNYWQNGEYYAFGASAHGYVNGTRYETVRDLDHWLGNPLSGEYRPCPASEQLENALIFGLRLKEGVNIPALEKQFAFDFTQRFGAVFEKYRALDLMGRDGDMLFLTDAAIPLSNAILADFMD